MERYNVHDEYMTPSEAGNVVLHADAQRALDAERRERHAVEQVAGQALGYPWFKDDQKNFPGATEADGVCIGEHVAGTIVQELASKLAALQAQLRQVEGQSQQQAEEAVIVFAKYTTLQQLVEALINSDTAKDHDKAWFALRATLAAQDAGKEDVSHE